ncbi:Heterokaryon incompatibility protein 6,OR allele [Lachnellula subtilissima]|uniref:Heterokaryon incompatibility protein 6,OR allele n=1 Tax=Lachnellula subtilissima TaxID=602034 RepID=A0A8H8RVV9_9HELO|nr:Heterokaryon incompatibility protein 6,OR allele [Lachnellula subtilissima]
MEPYVYKPLETDEIRLLEFRYGDHNAELEANLRTYRLPENEEPRFGHQVFLTRDGGFDVPNAPEYQALSYPWGLDTSTRFLLKMVDGQSRSFMLIKPNLDDALRQLRTFIPRNSSQLFWIDAICIDQDNVSEKNMQIKKMAMIYNRADSVAVWLGREDKDSRRAIEFIKRLLELNDFDPLTRDPGTPPEWAALLNLMQREWFNRRWIVQEIALARRATVFCGNQSVSWQDFSSAVALFTSRHHDLRQLFRSLGDVRAGPHLLGEVDALGAKALVDVTNNLFRKSEDGIVLERLLSLEALISSLTAFEASSPHDTIYAVLWLAHDAEPDSKELAAMSQDAVMQTPAQSPDIDAVPSPSPDPDEEMSSLKLQDDFTPFPQKVLPRTSLPGSIRRPPSPSRLDPQPSLVRKETSLRPPNAQFRALSGRSATDRSLKRAEKHFEEGPEHIIVDYKMEVYDVCRQFLEFAITRSKSLDIICHPWAPEPPDSEAKLPSWITPVSKSPFKRIAVQGGYARVHADPLVGTPGNGSRNYNASGKTKPYPGRGFIVGRTLMVTGFLLDAIKVKTTPATDGIIPSDWLDLVKWSGQQDQVPDGFWRTLVADRGPEGHKHPPAYFPLACKWVFDHSGEYKQVNTSKMLESGSSPSIATEFLRRVQSVIWGRKLASSEGRRGSKQLLALVPSDAEEGDLLCIIYGCSVPVVLRRRKKRKTGDIPTFTRESTREGKRALILEDNFEFSVPHMNTFAKNDRGHILAEDDQPSKISSAGLIVPVEHPNSAFSSYGVRKVLGEDAAEPKPPSLTVSLDSQQQYTFVGECYVHGMMAGEGFKHQHEHGNSLKAFHLV